LSLGLTSNYTRFDANYTINLNTYIPIPSADDGGEIQIEFPNEYIMDQFYSTCSTDVEFSLYVVCYKFYNTIKYRAANSLYDTRVKALDLNIFNLRNAENSGFTGPIIVKNYDKTNKKILSRSFGTLSASYLNFQEDG